MKHRFLWLFLAAVLLVCMQTSFAITGDNNGDGLVSYEETGELVSMLQTRLRELDYFHFKPTGSFRSMTREAVIKFQKNQEAQNGVAIIADGTVGEQTLEILFSPKAVRAPIATEVHIPIGSQANGNQTQVGNLTAWEEVATQLVAGNTYTLTDFNTGATFNMVYTGGLHHAEMECATANDATTYKETFGGEYNYSKRPMLITINGTQIACSLQGQPHGEDTVARNDMTGHACLYFDGSKSHVGALSDVEHVNNIYTASGQS